jgi:hypothetical protein
MPRSGRVVMAESRLSDRGREQAESRRETPIQLTRFGEDIAKRIAIARKAETMAELCDLYFRDAERGIAFIDCASSVLSIRKLARSISTSFFPPLIGS